MFPDTGLVVAGVLRTHIAAQRFVWNSPRANTALAATCDQEKCQQGGADSQVAAKGFKPLPTETYGRMGAPVHAFLDCCFSCCSGLAGHHLHHSGWDFEEVEFSNTSQKYNHVGGLACACNCRWYSSHSGSSGFDFQDRRLIRNLTRLEPLSVKALGMVFFTNLMYKSYSSSFSCTPLPCPLFATSFPQAAGSGRCPPVYGEY
jgi:hypothetical protein